MLNSDNAFWTVNEEQEAPAVAPQHHWEQVNLSRRSYQPPPVELSVDGGSSAI
jgi:hypothetical protein